MFALFGFGFLALAEIFVYVGGVLVLLLFAIMLVHRSAPGSPSIESRHDLLALVACIGLFGFFVVFLRPLATGFAASGGLGADGVDALGEVLLGPLLPQFELAGVLLLASLVAVVSDLGRWRVSVLLVTGALFCSRAVRRPHPARRGRDHGVC